MNDRSLVEKPAAATALCFALGIGAGPLLQPPWQAAAGLAAIGILSAARRQIRLAILAGCFAAGITLGGQLDAEDRRLGVFEAAADEFSVVSVPLEGSWTRTASGYRLPARHFRVEGRLVERPMTIYLSSEPPPVRDEARLTAEGFLARRDGNRFVLTCKSPRLITYYGKVSPLHPRYWNRRADQELTRLAVRRPEHARSVALAKALALGRSGELPAELREDYRRGGTYHLLVFSGMQIALAAGAAAFLLRQRLPRTKDLVLLVLAMFAPLFAGNEPSVSRAAIMIGIYSATRLMKRPTPLENLFFVSAAARLAIAPWELSDPGFALTYAATGGLLFIGRPLARRARHPLSAAMLYSFGAEIATLPLTLRFFHQYVLGGSIVTLLLTPVLGAMLAAAAAACILVFISSDAAGIALKGVALLDSAATAVNGISGETLRLARMGLAPSLLLVVIVYTAAAILIGSRQSRPALCCAVLMLPLLESMVRPMILREVPHPQIEFLDVQQGDAVLIRSGRSAVLLDTGGRRDDPEFGRRVLLPKLLDRGVRFLDAVILSHPHPDHCAALQSLLSNLTVRELWIAPSHLREHCAAEAANLAFIHRRAVHLVRPGDALRIEEITLRFTSASRRFKRASMNNSSVVASLHARGRTILLTGDIEKEAEEDLVSQPGRFLRAEVLKIAHHGSRNSTTEGFLREVRPTLAILSCGSRNPFGHPHPSVLTRLGSQGVRLWRTDRHGDIKVVLRGRAVDVLPQIDTPGGPP